MWLLLLACTSLSSTGKIPQDTDRVDSGGDPGSSGGEGGGEDSATAEPPSQCSSPAPALAYAPVEGVLDTTDEELGPMEQGAAALADLDGDGDDDLLISMRMEGLYLQLNEGGIPGEPRLLLDHPRISAIALGDLDGDGDLDAIVAGHEDRPALLRNDGAAGFSEEGEEAGMPNVGSTIRGASVGDVDLDGDLDVLLAVASEGPDMVDRLLENDGTGFYTDISHTLPDPIDAEGLSWDPVLSDLDRDGDLDIYLVNAEQTGLGVSRLLRNDRGSWTELTETCYCAETGNPMGATIADFNGDLRPDLYITGTGANWMLQSVGDGTYVNVAPSLHATALSDELHMAYGAMAVDHDNDGAVDLLVAAGPLGGGGPPEQADVLLRGGGEFYVDVAPDLGLDDLGVGRAALQGDWNGDGLPELMVSHLGSPSPIYQSPCTEARALMVELRGSGGNSHGLGAWVEVDTASGTQLREVTTRAGWASGVHPRAWFGLGQETPERLRVYWLGGEVQEIELGPETPLHLVVAQGLGLR